jgi:hypothetical protein
MEVVGLGLSLAVDQQSLSPTLREQLRPLFAFFNTATVPAGIYAQASEVGDRRSPTPTCGGGSVRLPLAPPAPRGRTRR